MQFVRQPRLKDKVAIVTGAGSRGPGTGNGKAAAILFAREGAKVLLVDLCPERAEETMDIIEKENGHSSTYIGDVTNESDCRDMVETVVQRYGRLDIVDNNVGIPKRQTVLEVSQQDWDHVMETNVKSVMLTSKYAIPELIRCGGGSIITTSSIAGIRAHGTTPYSASKAAVIGLTMSMAADHGPENIRVNCIAPGLVYTPMVANSMTEGLRERRAKAAMLNLEGSAWDIGWAAVYLASDESRWVTGVVLPVDGGISALSPVTYDSLRDTS